MGKTRIVGILRKPQKCPVCGERVVGIIYGTGDFDSLGVYVRRWRFK